MPSQVKIKKKKETGQLKKKSLYTDIFRYKLWNIEANKQMRRSPWTVDQISNENCENGKFEVQ